MLCLGSWSASRESLDVPRLNHTPGGDACVHLGSIPPRKKYSLQEKRRLVLNSYSSVTSESQDLLFWAHFLTNCNFIVLRYTEWLLGVHHQISAKLQEETTRNRTPASPSPVQTSWKRENSGLLGSE